MTIPASAPVAAEAIDPSDIVDFEIDLSAVLDPDETFDAIAFAVMPESVLLGFTILDAAPHQPVEVADARLRIWVSVDQPYHDKVEWRGSGTLCGIEFTARTNKSRTWQRTVAIRVIEK